MNKKITAITLASAMLFTSCGVVDKLKEKFGEVESAIDSKSEEYLEKYDPKSLAKDEAEEIFEYLKAKDIDKLTALFSKSAGSEEGLKNQWKKFFESIDGNIESYKSLDFPGEGMTIDKNGEITDSHLDIEYKKVTTDKGAEYEIGYYQTRKYPKNTDIEGINLFCINYRDEKGLLTDQFTVGRMPTK